MIIKKFQANSETEAIMLAKEELGKDAIVMNIKTILPRGLYRLFKKPLVEITAAVDEGIPNKPAQSQPATQARNAPVNSVPEVPVRYTQTRNTPVNNTLVRNTPVNNAPMNNALARGQFSPDIIYDEPAVGREAAAPSAIEAKLNNLQSLLEKQLGEKETLPRSLEEPKPAQPNKNLACIQLIYNQLVSNEVDEIFANQVLGEIEGTLKRDASMDNILASIYQKIILKLGQPRIIEITETKPKFVFFIGPTGVGKTTTIAKIASKFKMKDKARVAFLTADTYRIAAVEQLRTYANILGIPLKIIYSEEELLQAKSEFSDYDLVFVDTAGRSHRSKEQRDDIEALIDTIPEEEREVYLVLSATTKYRDLMKITEVYREIADYSLIFTKLDETSAIGNLFNVRMLTKAPLSYATFGQNVPDDIEKVNAQDIAKQLLRGQ